jgi:hypothetical protein
MDGVTATTAELNIMDGVTSTATEINKLDALDRGSIIYGNSSSVTTVLGQGSADQVLTSDGTDIAWADVDAAPPTTTNTVGTYIFGEGQVNNTISAIGYGDQKAGSEIRPTSASGDTEGSFGGLTSGTWRCMGNQGSNNVGNKTTVFVRIS